MRLVRALLWEHRPFAWAHAAFAVYDPPTALRGRWNEVLVPAGRGGGLVGALARALLEGEGVEGGAGGAPAPEGCAAE